jgi:putative DNA primase/helicase
VIPYPGDGKYWRLKPTTPLEAGRKYECPKGVPIRAYIPDATRSVLSDPSVPLILTEGEKKTLAALQAGFHCVGLGGVEAWSRKRPKDKNGKSTGPRELLPELDPPSVAWTGRKAYIVYDSDAATNPNVQWAEWRLAEALAKVGAVVRVVRLPASTNGEKVGLDDFLLSHSADDLRKLIDAATEPQRPPRKPRDSADPGDSFDNPHRLAEGFLRYVSRVDDEVRLRYYRGEFFEWSGHACRALPNADLRARVTDWIRGEFVKVHADAMKNWQPTKEDAKEPTVAKVTGTIVDDTINALKGRTLLPALTESPAWIDGATGPDPIAIRPVANGLLDLHAAAAGKAKALLAHTPRFFVLGAADYDYLANAPPPHAWLEFLGQIWPDAPDCIADLQEWFGYLLTPDTSLQKIGMLVGPKRSGKGTIFRVVKGLVGKRNVSAPTLGSLATNFGLSPYSERHWRSSPTPASADGPTRPSSSNNC